MSVAIEQPYINRVSSLYSSLTIHTLQNVHIVLSDSERELDDDSDDANTTKRCLSHRGSISKGGTDNASNLSNDDDLHGFSDESDNNPPNATSIKSNLTSDIASTRSDTDTLSQIGRSKAVKRKADTRGFNPHSIVTSALQVSSGSDLSMNDDERRRKSQRLTRGHGGRTVDYDMKHHPMDDFLRPGYSAKRRGNVKQISEVQSDNDEEMSDEKENEALSKLVTQSDSHRRRSSRNLHLNEQPIYSAKWHPLDEMLKDNASEKRFEGWDHSKITRKSRESSSALNAGEDSITITSDTEPDQDAAMISELKGRIARNSPGQRRSARISSSKDGPRNYDMKYGGIIHLQFTLRLTAFPRYHVMDSVLRPKAAAKRIESRLLSTISSKSISKSASSDRVHAQKPAGSSPKPLTKRSVRHKSGVDGAGIPVAPARSQLQNPYLNHISITWDDVQELDRRIYLFQKGAPLNSNTLPQDWTNETFNRVFSDEGNTTFDELNSSDNIELLKNRYESVRLGLQKFFDSKSEPANKNCWTLSKTEGFDVYEMKSGSRYWRHQKESVVEGTRISTSSRSTPATAKYFIANGNRKAMDGSRERHVQNEAITLKSMQDVTEEGESPNKPRLGLPQILGVDSERVADFDHEDNSERGAITETEDSLIESMREGHFSSSIMSDAALEELFLPAELDLKDEAEYEVTADLVLSDSKGSELAGRVLAHPDKAFDKFSCGLVETVQMNKEKLTSGDLVCPKGTSDKPRAPKRQMKAKKRKSRVDFAVVVHEDPPGRTLFVKKVVRTNPVSPGTDIPKENLEGDGSVGDSSQVETGMPQTRRQHRATGTPSTRTVRVASTTTPRHRFLSSSPASPRTVR